VVNPSHYSYLSHSRTPGSTSRRMVDPDLASKCSPPKNKELPDAFCRRMVKVLKCVIDPERRDRVSKKGKRENI
jgi:hypothetical protein